MKHVPDAERFDPHESEQPVLDLEDADGRPIAVSLFQAQGTGNLWHADISVQDRGDWLPLDLVALEELEEEGDALDLDGSLSLALCRIYDDEPRYEGVSTISAADVARIRAFGREQLAFRPQPRLRQSALSERLALA